jgi:membrane protein implicated in regulation of membrane protease activity
VKRLVFFLGIMVLITVVQLWSGQARFVLTLALILVLSVSVLYVIAADYTRAKRSRDDKKAGSRREDAYRTIAERIARVKGRGR